MNQTNNNKDVVAAPPKKKITKFMYPPLIRLKKSLLQYIARIQEEHKDDVQTQIKIFQDKYDEKTAEMLLSEDEDENGEVVDSDGLPKGSCLRRKGEPLLVKLQAKIDRLTNSVASYKYHVDQKVVYYKDRDHFGIVTSLLHSKNQIRVRFVHDSYDDHGNVIPEWDKPWYSVSCAATSFKPYDPDQYPVRTRHELDSIFDDDESEIDESHYYVEPDVRLREQVLVDGWYF